MTIETSRNTILKGAQAIQGQATQEHVIDRTKEMIDGVQRDAAAVSKVVQRSADAEPPTPENAVTWKAPS